MPINFSSVAYDPRRQPLLLPNEPLSFGAWNGPTGTTQIHGFGGLRRLALVGSTIL